MKHYLIPLQPVTDVDWLVSHLMKLNRAERIRVTLLSVQAPLSRHVTRFLTKEAVHDFHHENGMKAISEVARRLDVAGIAHTDRVMVGSQVPCIVDYAEHNRCTGILLAKSKSILNQIGFGSIGSQLRHLLGVERGCEISEAY